MSAPERPPPPSRCSSPTCRVCGAALDTSIVRFSDICDAPECRIRATLSAVRPSLLREAEERTRRQQQAEEALARHRDEVLRGERSRRAASLGIADPEEFALGVVPHNDLPLTPLPAERGDRFAEHLSSVIAEACSSASHPESNTAPLPYVPIDVQRAACDLCRGQCCRSGGEHAYQDVESMRRFMASHPELDADGILRLYLARLPSHSYEGACVFQAEHGCALPRDIRSRTCNRYLCGDLRRLGVAMERAETERAFVGAFREAGLVRAEFLPRSPLTSPTAHDAAPADS